MDQRGRVWRRRRQLAVRRLIDGGGVAALLFEDVEFWGALKVAGQQPERRPEALAARELGADLEISVLLGEGRLGVQ